MRAAVIAGPGQTPVAGEFREPETREGYERVRVSASAITNLSKGRASGRHYSSAGAFPSVPGSEGVGRTENGRRIYFALPEAPFGSLAEFTLVARAQCIPVPDNLDDVTAAALGNPGMSAWTPLVHRAHLAPGETVLVNGATGAGGRLAVQLAKHLGAARVVVTGRNQRELDQIEGADTAIAFPAGADDEAGWKQFEEAVTAECARGIDVVVDYLWGPSARILIVGIARGAESTTPVRFVQVGEISGSSIELPGAAFRSSAIQLMGSGLKSVPLPTLLDSIAQVFAAAGPASLAVETVTMPLDRIAEAWQAPTKPRVVVTI